MRENQIIVRALIHATREKTWNFYTAPAHIVQWNFADPSWHCPAAQNDLCIGGQYLARMEAKDGSFGFDFEATYTEMHLGHGFVYQFGERFASVEFQEQPTGTEVIIRFDPENEHSLELQRDGWQAILNNFKKHCEASL